MNKSKFIQFAVLVLLNFALSANGVSAQQSDASAAPKSLTADDYARAEKFMAYNTMPLVDRPAVRPNWLPDGRFWYRNVTGQGSEFVLVNPATGARQSAFDQTKLAAALSTVAGAQYEAMHLPFTDFNFAPDGQNISFNVGNFRFKCDAAGSACAADGNAQAEPQRAGRRNSFLEVLSPDGKRAAFIRDWNLWMRDTATGKETKLTTDGVKDYGYATDNAGWTHSDRAILMWSPDSKKIATFQQDQRKSSDMYLVSTNVGAPRLEAWKYPLPGDENVTMIERVVIDVETPKVIRFQMPPDQHRTTLCDDISCDGNFTDVEWSADNSKVAFVSTSRDHKSAKLRIADAATGSLRDVMEETAQTQYESGQGAVNWRFLPKSNEVIWYSERDGWGHLYLYDLTTGKLKNQITKGDWVVWRLLKVDDESRTLHFVAGGREPGSDPYFGHFYRVGMDGKNLALLTPEDANHDITLSPKGNYFIDTYSKPDAAPVTVLRDLNGKIVSSLEKTDVSRLVAAGWKAPQPIVVKARDGQTDLYGLMFTPTNLDPKKKYPIINYIYPGPQGGGVGSRSFAPSRGDNQALAELGFVVVSIDGTCNPLRSKKFHDACYGNMADNTLADQVAGMQQLAQKYPYIDIERAGIWGHSGGGFATAAAMFRYPDFFKVGISESGNHDNRNYEDDWGERYIGLLTKDAGGKSNYSDQDNPSLAKNLKGHLLLAHGTMDDNVPPSNTLLVVNELIKANKDFDLLMIPNARHGYGEYSLYMTRRRWDYFVRYLMGAEPPKNYQLRPTPAPR